jgi:hypothetical protein
MIHLLKILRSQRSLYPASGDETKTITTEITQSIDIECSGTDVTCSANQGRSRHDISMSSIRKMK